MKADIRVWLQLLSKPFFYTASVVCCAGGFGIETLYNFNQVGVYVVLFYCGPEGCMPYTIECFLGVHKHMKEVLLVLKGTSHIVFSAWKYV